MHKLHYTLLLLLVLFTFSCKKTEEKVPDKSRFYRDGGKPYVTPFSLYQINDPANSTSAFMLNFYDKKIGYDLNSDSFNGSGNMITLNFNTSLFKTNLTQQVFKVDNLEEGIIEVLNGTAWLDYNFTTKSGSTIKIMNGRLTVWKYQDRYKLNYKLNLEGGATIEGAFFDAMSITYK